MSATSDNGLVDRDPGRLGSMTAINSGPVGEVGGVRLPLQSLHGYGSVFMYSASTSPVDGQGAQSGGGGGNGSGGNGTGEVTLRLREPEDIPEEVLARLEDTATLSISLQGDGVLRLSSASTGNSNLELFDSESGPDLTLSPQTFTSTAEAFINDNSDSLGVPGDNDMSSSEELRAGPGEPGKLGVKKSRPKASSPNRQGPQQCQVCGKVFNNASALTKHKLTHSDERKYVCTMCGKAFKRQDHLNGHMLTHRNKKPFECKADGCGKSYCDARSLRRHTENHHAGSKVNESTSPSSPTTGPHTPNTPGSNPGTPNTPGAPTAQNGHGHTALKQLLATEPAAAAAATTASASTQLHNKNSTSGGNNDGLTKHQIELIQQIMHQTHQQQQPNSQASLSSPGSGVAIQTTKNGKTSTKSSNSPNANATINVAINNGTSSSPKPKVWGNHNQQQQSQQPQQQQQQAQAAVSSSPSNPTKASPLPANNITSASSITSANNNKTGTESKLVECSLCRRQFKNIPALNGHMRLHGGYFKKDGENKKNEKKESPGPPLQTASVNVRALIEEKIIQKRTTEANAANQARVNSTIFTSQTDVPNHIIGKTNFAIPAPPLLGSGEKIRKLSDTEHFRQPNVTVGGHPSVQKQLQEAQTQAQAQALADFILKGTTKMAGNKRTTPDPAQRVQLTYKANSQIIKSTTQPQQKQEQSITQTQSQQQQQQHTVSESFTMTGYSEDGGYFSPSLQDEVFQQVTVVPDSVLLQSSQLDSIQFQASKLLQDQSAADQLQDMAHDNHFTSQHTVNPDLQALVNSPLPESLAEFSTYGSQYTESPHTLSTQSPLPSPLTRHDSPSFTYPTPPASQEGLLSGTLPLLSPQDDPEAVRPVSSPLSAAFYTTTLSSAAEVEEALNAVLPEETEQDASDLYGTASSSNPNSPTTPAPSPLSSSLPTPQSSSSVSSSFLPSSPHHNSLQNQMMPNSEDPLLSSSPKDFAANRRKFEFQSYKLITTSQNLVDFGLGNGSLAGIVVDNNGEYKLIQTAGLQKTNLLLQSTPATTTTTLSPALTFRKEIRLINPKIENIQNSISTNNNTNNNNNNNNISNNNNIISQQFQQQQQQQQQININPSQFLIQQTTNIKNNLPISIKHIKQECLDDSDIFLSPENILSSPINQVQNSRKRQRINIEKNNKMTLYPSRLRRACDRHWDSSYTPPPILDPSRMASGLYARLHHNEADSVDFSSDDSQGNDGPPPRINIGTRYQASIPPASNCLITDTGGATNETGRGGRETDHLLWDPGINISTDNSIDMYLQFACCAGTPGGGRNKEYALYVLQLCRGNIHEAMLRLIKPTPPLPPGHPLTLYDYRDSDRWTSHEMMIFYQGLLEYNKDFASISRDISTKTSKQCIQFYYIWKKLCPDENQRVKEKHNKFKMKYNGRCGGDSKDTKELKDAIASVTEDMDLCEEKSILHRTLLQTNERESSATLTTSEGELRLFAYDCPDSFSGSVRVTMTGSNIVANNGQSSITTTTSPPPLPTNSQTHISSEQQLPTPLHYPCKICGKVFNKVKSRSAHMKSHRPIPSPDTTTTTTMAQESKKSNNHQVLHKQSAHNQGNTISQLYDYQKISMKNQGLNSNANNIWHNPTRLRPP